MPRSRTGLPPAVFLPFRARPDDLVARMKKDVVVMTEVVNTGGIRIE